MSKIKTAFFCSNCGYESAKWLGKCPSCNQWNTFIEEVLDKGNNKEENWDTYNNSNTKKGKALLLHEVSNATEKRLVTTDAELNRVLGDCIG
jgi:DNA repair protein RadA/Sms